MGDSAHIDLGDERGSLVAWPEPKPSKGNTQTLLHVLCFTRATVLANLSGRTLIRNLWRLQTACSAVRPQAGKVALQGDQANPHDHAQANRSGRFTTPRKFW